MLCSCVNIKAKKFKFYYNFNVQQRNNNLSNNTFALFEANCSIEEDFVIIVCNIIVTLCCCCFKRTFSNASRHTLLAYQVLCDTYCSHHTLRIVLRE